MNSITAYRVRACRKNLRIGALIVLVSLQTVFAVCTSDTGSAQVSDDPKEGSCGEGLSWRLSENTLVIDGSGPMFDFNQGSSPWYRLIDKIKSLTLPAQIGSIGNYAFYNCKYLTDLSFPGTVSLTTIGDYAFYNCSQMKGSLNIPSCVTYIGEYAFQNTHKISDHYQLSFGSGQDKARLSHIGNHAFDGCSGFSGDLNIPDSITYLGSYAFTNCKGFDTLEIPSTLDVIREYTFHSCDFGNDDYVINIPNGITVIEKYQFYMACTGRLSLPDTLESIGENAFHTCDFNGNLSLPENLRQIGDNQFYDCDRFTGTLTLPDSLVYVGNYQFYGCSGFTGALTLPEMLTSIGEYSFYKCTGFTSLTIPEGITTIGRQQFMECSGFTGTLAFPGTVTAIESDQFYRCSGFTGSLIIPDSVVIVGSNQFRDVGCNMDLKLSTNLISIGPYQFYNYTSTNITNLLIPASLTSIGNYAFDYDGSHEMSHIIQLSVMNGCSNISNQQFGNRHFYDENQREITVGSKDFIGYLFKADGTNMVRQGPVQQFTVTYDVLEGSDPAPKQSDMPAGGTFVVKPYSGSKSGYKFGGWIYNGQICQPGDVITVEDSDIVITAHWIALHVVGYRAEGGSGTVPPQEYHEIGDEITVFDYRGTKKDHQFGGWRYNGMIYKAGDKIIVGDSDIYLEAVWIQYHSVTYDPNGGIGPVPVQNVVLEGKSFTVQAYEGERPRYQFVGWLYQGTYYLQGDSIVMGSNDIVLLALWLKCHSVTYDANEGSGDAPIQPDVQEGMKFKAQECTFTRPGFLFLYWEYNVEFYEPGEDVVMGYDDIVLKAVWERGFPKHNVIYDLDGGIGEEPRQPPVEEGTKFSVLNCDATKVGYVLEGWIYNDSVYYPNQSIIMGTEDILLIANWVPETPPSFEIDFVTIISVIVGGILIQLVLMRINGIRLRIRRK